jgi:hypothetical protein
MGAMMNPYEKLADDILDMMEEDRCLVRSKLVDRIKRHSLTAALVAMMADGDNEPEPLSEAEREELVDISEAFDWNGAAHKAGLE